jgi:hypothetical protein
VLADSLVHAWMGARFAGSVVPMQLLLGVVLVRAGTSSASVILKGAGQHKLLAATNASAGAQRDSQRHPDTPARAGGSRARDVHSRHRRRAVRGCIGGLPPLLDITLRRALVQAMWPAAWPTAITAVVLWLDTIDSSDQRAAGRGFSDFRAVVYADLFVRNRNRPRRAAVLSGEGAHARQVARRRCDTGGIRFPGRLGAVDVLAVEESASSRHSSSLREDARGIASSQRLSHRVELFHELPFRSDNAAHPGDIERVGLAAVENAQRHAVPERPAPEVAFRQCDRAERSAG